MKPFNLERALAGDPVVTRDGRPVNELTLFKTLDDDPVVGVLNGTLLKWASDGHFHDSSIVHEFDLFMAPIKRTVYVNFYQDGSCNYHSCESDARSVGVKRQITPVAWAVPVEVEF